MPKIADIHIQKTAPAPPETIAVATPAMLPIPSVAERVVARVLNGERFSPGERALWFYNSFGEPCMDKWWNQWNTGKYKSHCFYAPSESENCY